MRGLRLSKEFKVGLLAVVSLSILYMGFYFLKGVDFFSPNNTYYAVYQNIDGLNVSNPVMINGFAVGRVSSIEILPRRNNMLLVALDVDDDQVLGSGTRAIIQSDLLGSMAIHLDSILVGEPVEEGDTLQAVLNKGITEEFTNSALPLVDRLEVTIQNLNTILANLANNEEDINAIIGNFKTTSGNIATGTRNLDAMTGEVGQLLAKLNHPEEGVGALMAKMNQVADTVNQLEMQAMLNSTRKTVDQLSETLALIKEGEGSLGLLLTDKELYNRMNQTMEDLDQLFIDMKENPGRYVHFSIFGRKNKDSDSSDQIEEE